MAEIGYEKEPNLISMPETLDKVNIIPYNSSNGPMIVNNFTINLRCKSNFLVKWISKISYTNYYEG